tara:strand:- start:125 stop:655 length:531 start_codon:yes stop_codon:yes gene_type:complete
MKKINTKSYNWIFNVVKKLEKERILLLEKKGQSQICRINLGEKKTVIYFSLLEELNSLSKKIPNLEKIRDLIEDFHILMITGSYVDGSYTKKSDMDVVVVIDKEEKKWLLNKLINKGELMIPKLHVYVFTREEFLEMLINKEENYGKEIERKHLIVSGPEFYFNILKEAIDNGYKG